MKIKEIKLEEVKSSELSFRMDIIKEDGAVINCAGITLEATIKHGMSMILDELPKKSFLGNATCEELISEISARIEIHGPGLNYSTTGSNNEEEKIK